jgi:putative ABC transport system permease protein
MIDRPRADVTAAIRGLISTPVTTLATALLLAVAVGANLAVFGLIDRAILTPARHVVHPDRLFTLSFGVPGEIGAGMTTTSYVAFTTLRDHAPLISPVAAWRRTTTTAIVDRDQHHIEAMVVSGSYFDVLGASARMGRAIEEADDQPSGEAAVISNAFWQSAFGGDAGVIGRRISIDRIEYRVAGVMPAGFSGHSSTRVDAWVPIAAAMRRTPGWNLDAFRNVVSVIGRVEPKMDVSAAEQASAALERRVSLVTIAGGDLAANDRRIAYALMGVSLLVLAIGLANAATLLLVRGRRRHREASIRSALGASRARLSLQIVLESAIVATMATLGALALSSWSGQAIRQLLLEGMIETDGLSWRTAALGLTAGLATFSIASAVGILQLPRAGRPIDLGGATFARRRSRAHVALLLVQTTLSVTLLASAGMFARSLYNLMSQDFGMRLSDTVLVGFERGPEAVDGQAEIFTAALQRIRAMPGVTAATPIRAVPFSGFHVPPIGVPGMADSPSVGGQLPHLIAATPEFLDILGIEVVQGRRFTAADETSGAAPVVIVNETMARGVWPGATAIGKCIRLGFDPSFNPMTADGPPGPPTTVPCREVVGIARDVRQRSVVPGGLEDRLMQYYVPFSQVPGPPAGIPAGPGIQGLLVRTAVPAETLVASIRRLVVDGRNDLPFVEVRPYFDLLAGQMRPWRLGTTLLATFAALAVIVAGVGLFAVFAHAISERRREMAIRLAVGARPGGLMAMVLREAAYMAGGGVLCGGALAILGGRWMQSMLVGTAPADPVVLATAGGLMIGVAMLATIVPARSATRADPIDLLKAE